LRSLQPDTPPTRLLRTLVEARRRLVNDKTQQKNRLTATLKMYFPQILQWFDEVDSPLVSALLQRWSSLGELKRCHPGTLKKFFLEHNCRGQERIRKRLEAIGQAVSATEDEAIVVGGSLQARMLVETIALLRGQIAEYDRRIAELVDSHPDSGLFAS